VFSLHAGAGVVRTFMSGPATLFVDTNVLVYSRDRGEPVKGPRAQDLLGKIFQTGPPLISVQVLSEFFWTVTRKLSVPLTQKEAATEARRFVMRYVRIVPLGFRSKTP